MAESTNQYEGMFLLPASATADVEAAVGLVRGMIERHGGEIMVIKKWDDRKLAYEIEGQTRGLYVIAFFRAPGGAVAAIDRDVNLSEEVLRVLMVKADHLSQEEMERVEPQREERPPAARGERGDRSERGERGERGERHEGRPGDENLPEPQPAGQEG